MNVKSDIAVHPDHIRFDVSGDYSLERLFEFLINAKAEAVRTGRDRILIDGREVSGKMSESDKFLGGKRIAEVFGSRIKLALIMRAEDITKLGELTAVNRGARFFVTSSEDEATKWLLS